MKHLLAFITYTFFCGLFAQSQLIGKFRLSKSINKDAVPIVELMDKAKSAIKAYNAKGKKTLSDLDSLSTYLKSDPFSNLTPFLSMADSLMKLDAIPEVIDTLKPNTSTIIEGRDSEPCDGIQNISDLIAEKDDEGEYLISFVDKDENPLKSFTLKEYNEPLFFDKIEEALNGLCGSTTLTAEQEKYIDSLVAGYRKEKLFEKLLIASLIVKDDDVLAGKLSIYKHLEIEVKSRIPDSDSEKKSKKSDSSTRASLFFPNYALDISGRNEMASKANTLDSEMSPGNLNSFRFIWKKYHKFYFDDPGDSVKSGGDSIRKNIKTETARFTVHEIQIQFQDGFIENIKVLGKKDDNTALLKFENAYPIPFSTRRDFRKLYEKRIYERTIYAKEGNNRSKIFSCSIRLGDLMYYNQNLDLNVKDYSPENQIYERKLTEEVTTENLYKEKTSKILELKVFSDLKGIENEDPNGLIQMELSKKLNFWNNRTKLFNNNIGNIGWFNCVTPYFTMNKIENNNRRLRLAYFGPQQKDTMQANVFASTLSVLQHQTFGLGLNVTGITVDIPGLKSTLNLNTGFFYGRTLFEDTIRTKIDSSNFVAVPANNVKQFGINSFQIVPELTWQVFPDKRFGVIVSQKLINLKLLSSIVRQVRDSADYIDYIKSINGDRSKIDSYSVKRWIGASELFAFYQPSRYNKIFFRYRFNWDLDNVKTNFHQMQIGLLTFLSHTKKSKKELEDGKD